MQQKTEKLIKDLALKIAYLPEPIHLLAVCSGGSTLAKIICKTLKNEGKTAKYFEVWTDILGSKKKIRKTTFHKSDYTGTAVIVEDVIWKGSALPPIKKMLKSINSRKKIYIVSLFDCNNKGDFAIFH